MYWKRNILTIWWFKVKSTRDISTIFVNVVYFPFLPRYNLSFLVKPRRITSSYYNMRILYSYYNFRECQPSFSH